MSSPFPPNVTHFDDLPGSAILRREEVKMLVSLSDNTLDRQISEGEFPKPVRLGQRARGWRVADLRTYLGGLSA